MRKIILLSTAVASLSACQMQIDAEQSSSSLDMGSVINGFSKQQILSCAGSPAKRSKTADGEVWQYIYEAYKDPQQNPRNDWDANYVGLTYVTFVENNVSDVRYAASPSRSSFGFKVTEKMAASLSTPVLRNC